MLAILIKRFAANRSGNIAVITSISLLPLIFAAGMGLDYASATQKRARLNAVADATALFATTPAMMALNADLVTPKAQAFFDSQVVAVMRGVTYTPGSVSVVPVDTTTNGSKIRVVTVSYTATSTNAFGSALGAKTISIGGTSKSSATVASNIDFYLMIDTSPSMAIAATQADIDTMVANTANQGGCAFACHQTNPSAYNPSGIDNYQLAKNLGVKVRMDLVNKAVGSMIGTAASQEATVLAKYRIAGYSFDVATNNPIPLTSDLNSASPTSAASLSSKFQLLQVFDENYLTSSQPNGDMDTNFDQAFSTLNQAMPTPGNGTNAVGDTPQEVLFIVTDGVSDQYTNGQRIYTPFGYDQTWCSKIKARGIRIAVLYTTYNPLPTNGWYNTYIAWQQPSIGPTAQACASPNLYFKVDVGGDITTAMNNLFKAATKTAYLTQ